MAKKVIAMVDDEPDILELLKECVEGGGYTSKSFTTGKEILDFLENDVPDLLILDLMLPDVDGLDVCKQLRSQEKFNSLPIIMVTAKGEELDKVLGLELGADDYMTKPFSPRELMARIKALLRRSEYKDNPKEEKIINVSKSISLDTMRYKVYVNNEELKFTVTEFKILMMFAENRGFVLSREQILEKLWGSDRYSEPRTVDVHIRHIREKINDDGSLIENVRGIGYKLNE